MPILIKFFRMPITAVTEIMVAIRFALSIIMNSIPVIGRSAKNAKTISICLIILIVGQTSTTLKFWRILKSILSLAFTAILPHIQSRIFPCRHQKGIIAVKRNVSQLFLSPEWIWQILSLDQLFSWIAEKRICSFNSKQCVFNFARRSKTFQGLTPYEFILCFHYFMLWGLLPEFFKNSLFSNGLGVYKTIRIFLRLVSHLLRASNPLLKVEYKGAFTVFL